MPLQSFSISIHTANHGFAYESKNNILASKADCNNPLLAGGILFHHAKMKSMRHFENEVL